MLLCSELVAISLGEMYVHHTLHIWVKAPFLILSSLTCLYLFIKNKDLVSFTKFPANSSE